MHVPWLSDRCILCLADFELPPSAKRRTRAHVISDSIGGLLTVDCLCFECNSHLGDTWEKHLPLDPAVRLAIEALATSVPLLSEFGVRPGRRFIGRTEENEGVLRVKALGGDRYRLLPSQLEEGSRVMDGEDAEKEIARRLRKRGVGKRLIEEAVSAFRAGGRVQIGDNVFEPRTGEIQVGLPLDEPITPAEVFLGMAFLYLAINVEEAIYPPAVGEDPLAEVRGRCSTMPPRAQQVHGNLARTQRRGQSPWATFPIRTMNPRT